MSHWIYFFFIFRLLFIIISTMALCPVKQLIEFIVTDDIKRESFQLCLGDSLTEKANAFCENGISCTFLLMRHSIIELLRAFPTDIAINYFDTATQSNRVFAMPVDSSVDFKAVLQAICIEKNLSAQDLKCMQLSLMFLRASWDILDLTIRRVNEDYFVASANRIVTDERILFIIEPPNPLLYPPGLGNVLKGFLNSYSLHENTKIKDIPGYILGNFSSIFNSRHIYSEAFFGQVENSYSWRLHVTRQEEIALSNTPFGRFKLEQLRFFKDQSTDHMNNIDLHVLFSTTISIDGQFDRSILPVATARRILAGVRSTFFRPTIYASVTELVEKLLHPSLGVSVRSGRGPHEVLPDAPSRPEFDSSRYTRLIESVVRDRSIKSILLAFDDILLLPLFQPFLESLPGTIRILYTTSVLAGKTELEKAAIEMLSLSKTSFLVGDGKSSFLECIFWFGELRQVVYSVSAEPATSVTSSRSLAGNTYFLADLSDRCYCLTKLEAFSSITSCINEVLTYASSSIQTASLPLSSFDFIHQVLANRNIILSNTCSPCFENECIQSPYTARLLSLPWTSLNKKISLCKDLRVVLGNHLSVLNHLKSRDHTNYYTSPIDDFILQSTDKMSPISSHRLLCMVYSTDSQHSQAIADALSTWGSRCTGFLAFTNQTEPFIPTVSVPHEGEESYLNLWRKVVAIWKYVSIHYILDFDWFFLGGDDCILLVDALSHFLDSSRIVSAKATGNGLYLGRRFKIDNSELTFNGGGPGYVIDNIALKKLGDALSGTEDICEGTLQKFVDDVSMALCLSKLGIFAFDTRDENGRERFHHFSTETAVMKEIDGILIENTWWGQHFINYIPGIDGISDGSVTFHEMSLKSSLWVDYFLSSCQDEQKSPIGF